MTAVIQRLRAEIAFDRAAFEQRLAELAGLSLDARSAPGTTAQAAVALHHAYCAVESILVRVVRQLEGAIPEGADWHQSLLHSAALELPGVRPVILSRQTVDALRPLLGFRHFFRHGYAVALDPLRLADLSREAQALAPRLLDELGQLDDLLQQVAAIPGSDP